VAEKELGELRLTCFDVSKDVSGTLNNLVPSKP